MLRKKKNNIQARRPIYQPPTEVFSYHARRTADTANIRRSPGQAVSGTPRLRHWIKLLPSVLSVGAIIVSLFYATSLSTKPRFQVPNGTASPLLRDSAFYENATSTVLRRSILNYSKLTINTSKLAQELREQYPELGDVTVIIPLSGRRPVIEVKPAIPVLKLSGNGGLYIIDEQGRALLKASEARNNAATDVPYVIDQSGLELQQGRQVLPLSTISFIHNMTAQMHAKNIQIESITLPPIPNEIHLRLVGYGYFVKFETQGSAREQAGTLIAVQEELHADQITPLEYIDVRVPEKVFYK